MTDSEPPELRALREQAEARAWLEGALTRLENGSEGEQQLGAYMRVQIAEDEEAESAYLSWVGDPDVDDQPLKRRTRAQDRSGLELALMLLLGKGE